MTMWLLASTAPADQAACRPVIPPNRERAEREPWQQQPHQDPAPRGLVQELARLGNQCHGRLSNLA